MPSPAFTSPSAVSVLPRRAPARRGLRPPEMVAQVNRRARADSRARPRAAPGAARAPAAPPPALAPVVSRPVPGLANWRYAGPELDVERPDGLPAVVYFGLSAQQSLELEPYNQFVRFVLAGGDFGRAVRADVESDGKAGVRVFSVDLPFHGSMEENEVALMRWAERYEEGADVVSWFVRKVGEGVEKLVEEGHVGAVYAAGLSRGGLLAAHLGLRCEMVEAVLGFSPVTNLGDVREFKGVRERAQGDPGGLVARKLCEASLQTEEAVEGLSRVAVRMYSGNLDTRVGTRNCFEFMAKLAEVAAKRDGVRSPPHEYIMFCSLGREGHGTSSDVFCVGARWLLRRAGLRA